MAADLSQIVKAYDVRGVVPDQWDEALAELFGAAFTRVTGADAIVVGHDMRPSSPGLTGAFARGAAAQGADITVIGLCSTDQLYYASGHLGLPGAMFTASHNPAQYNGIKMCRAGAAPIGQDSGLADIRALVEVAGVGCPGTGGHARHRLRAGHPHRLRRPPEVARGPHVHPAPEGRRRRGQRHGRPHRPHRLRRTAPHPRPDVLRAGRHVPHHEANPSTPPTSWTSRPASAPRSRPRPRLRRRRRPLLRGRRARRAGLPVRHHRPRRRPRTGQAPRRHGHPQPDHVDVRAGGRPRERRHPVRTRVGHSFIKAEMARTGAIFGGEHSAHYYFRDFWNADTGMLAALHVLAALGGQEGTLSDLVASYDRYAASGEISSRWTTRRPAPPPCGRRSAPATVSPPTRWTA